ncbi:GNAT family N-acetyltransferase [Streptacidiphilus rugosus]|uniref:GNAT family N-acetyltransferase n=1 Tax=Streptacidiphilus rugosus TaxID=405783 RepID=UPI00055F7E5B|nr:GNAT family N-acetyltransferase [Streptacidiphilus rugosus]
MSADGATELTWRPLERGDVAAWRLLLEIIEAVEREDEHPSEQDLLERFDDPYVDTARGSMAVWDGDRMVGYHWMKARTAADPQHDFWQVGGVDPEYRGRGIGARLLGWAEQAALPLHEERFPGAPLALMDGCVVGSASEALFRQLGYEQVRWYHNMVVADLATAVAELPASPVPDGVVFLPFTAERSADALRVRNDAFRDHYGSVPQSSEGWAHFVGGTAFRPDGSFIAYERGQEGGAGAPGQPLAIVLAEEYDGHRQATGRRDLYVALVGTARAGRKRGIASALLAHALRRAAADGFDTSTLGVDMDSPTGAVGLYERLGYRPEQSYVAQQKFLRR